MFCERDVKGVKYTRRNGVPKAIGLGMGGITNKYSRGRAGIDFGGGWGRECESAATDFSQVGKGGCPAKPEFVWRAAAIGGGGRQRGEVRCG
jgi:hypothetical protein